MDAPVFRAARFTATSLRDTLCSPSLPRATFWSRQPGRLEGGFCHSIYGILDNYRSAAIRSFGTRTNLHTASLPVLGGKACTCLSTTRKSRLLICNLTASSLKAFSPHFVFGSWWPRAIATSAQWTLRCAQPRVRLQSKLGTTLGVKAPLKTSAGAPYGAFRTRKARNIYRVASRTKLEASANDSRDAQRARSSHFTVYIPEVVLYKEMQSMKHETRMNL